MVWSFFVLFLLLVLFVLVFVFTHPTVAPESLWQSRLQTKSQDKHRVYILHFIGGGFVCCICVLLYLSVFVEGREKRQNVQTTNEPKATSISELVFRIGNHNFLSWVCIILSDVN